MNISMNSSVLLRNTSQGIHHCRLVSLCASAGRSRRTRGQGLPSIASASWTHSVAQGGRPALWRAAVPKHPLSVAGTALGPATSAGLAGQRAVPPLCKCSATLRPASRCRRRRCRCRGGPPAGGAHALPGARLGSLRSVQPATPVLAVLAALARRLSALTAMILLQVHLQQPCYDFCIL